MSKNIPLTGEDKNIKIDMINKMVDIFDDATMICYDDLIDEDVENIDVTNYDTERGRLNFYECLFKVIDYFLEEKELKVSDDALNKIDVLLNEFRDFTDQYGINTEEIRKALLLLDIKAFKNINFPLYFITPDIVGMIFAILIDSIYENSKIQMLDFNFGTGNLAFTILNHSKNEFVLTGIDNHPLLANVGVHKANMLMVDMNMYYEDALNYLTKDIDLFVSDIANFEYENDNYHSFLYDEGVRYFPYLAIEHYLQQENPAKYMFLIDSDFFGKENNEKFRQLINDKASIDALIVLPRSFFQNDEDVKSILILSNEVTDKETLVVNLPSLEDKKLFLETLEKVKKHLKG